MKRKPVDNLVFVCKTYRNDLAAFKRLLGSLKRHNPQNIRFYVSVPSEDAMLFEEVVGRDAVVVRDEEYARQYLARESYWGLSPGYVNQEICKLTFWKTGLANNYLFIDSDAYFIRDFTVDDFMANATTPYSVLVMDKDLQTENFYKEFGRWRKDRINEIFNMVGLNDPRMLTCHGMTVLNARVLEDFEKNFMLKKRMTYSDLIKVSPYEYSWYNAWLQKCKIIDVIAVEPFFKTYHMRMEYIFSRLRLVKERDLASQYVGVILNSNWSKKPPSRYKDPGVIEKIINGILSRIG